MNDKTNGGPAFPTDYVKHEPQEVGNNVAITEHSPGMTLRDYFAAKAMQGMITGPDFCDMFPTYGHSAEAAYKFADAMLKARSAS